MREPNTFTATTQLLARAESVVTAGSSASGPSRAPHHVGREGGRTPHHFQLLLVSLSAPPSEVRKLLSRHSYSWVLDTIWDTWSRCAPRCLKVEVITEFVSALSAGKPGIAARATAQPRGSQEAKKDIRSCQCRSRTRGVVLG